MTRRIRAALAAPFLVREGEPDHSISRALAGVALFGLSTAVVAVIGLIFAVTP